jgi:ribosomal protein L16 Arg81 hydroxylase
MTEYRGRQVVHFPGASNRFAALLDLQELSSTLSRLVVSPGIFRLVRPEGQVPLDRFLTSSLTPNRDRRVIRAAALEAELKAGATMVIEHAESLSPGIFALGNALADAFTARVNANFFLVYQDRKPAGLHWDDRDMFICQIAGRKKWPVYQPVYPHPLFDSARSGGPIQASPRVDDFLLNAGDSFYVPRGWPHNPESDGGFSAHVAFAIATPTGNDLLEWIQTDLTNGCDTVRADLPLAATKDARREYARALREKVMEKLTDDAIDLYCQRHQLNVFRKPVTLPAAEPAVLSGMQEQYADEHR